MCRPDYRAKKQQNNVRPDTVSLDPQSWAAAHAAHVEYAVASAATAYSRNTVPVFSYT